MNLCLVAMENGSIVGDFRCGLQENCSMVAELWQVRLRSEGKVAGREKRRDFE